MPKQKVTFHRMGNGPGASAAVDAERYELPMMPLNSHETSPVIDQVYR